MAAASKLLLRPARLPRLIAILETTLLKLEDGDICPIPGSSVPTFSGKFMILAGFISNARESPSQWHSQVPRNSDIATRTRWRESRRFFC